MKLLMVKTVAHCAKIKINEKFAPTTNVLHQKAMSAIEIMSRQIAKTGRALRICHFAEFSGVRN